MASPVQTPPGIEEPRQSGGPRPVGLGVTGWLRWGWRQLTSMRTALVLLFLLALASVPGSLLPQRGLDAQKVDQYLAQHRTLGPLLDRLSLFDVFAAPWFAAIYLLLFVSLAGCVVPRAWQHARHLRSRPPVAPRNLARLPHFDSFVTDLAPEEAVRRAALALRRRRFRLGVVATDHATGPSAAAEKGYLRETGNLVFHLALLALLFAVAAGSLFGYKGNVLLTEGEGFANAVTAYDVLKPGHLFTPGHLQPFSLTLDRFRASYLTDGPRRGQPADFAADMRVRAEPGAPTRSQVLRVNHPLHLDGAKVYLLGHGYSPTFRVTDGTGQVAFDGPVPFLPADRGTYTSEGVVKVPDARPTQLGFYGVFLPTTVQTPQGLVSVFPAPDNPTVTLVAFKGDLGLDSGTPQSVYQLNVSRLTRLSATPTTLRPGQSLPLPGGAGSITFTGYRQWISLQVTYDPGRLPALIAAILAITGLIPALLVQRRRVWVRGRADEAGRTVVEIGGLTRTDAGEGFASEFGDISGAVRAASDTHDKE